MRAEGSASLTSVSRSWLPLRIAALLMVILVGSAAAHAARPAATQAAFNGISTTRHVVALTFDDGPGTSTPGVLAALRKLHIHATFFVVGYEVVSSPQLVRAEVKAGNEIGDHTYHHPDLQGLTAGQIEEEVQQTQEAILDAAGVTPRWLRPPYDEYDPRVVGVVQSLGLGTATWNVDPQDWTLPGTAAIATRVLSAVRPGSVILLHDGGGDRSETVAALPWIVHALKKRGYRFVTLSRLAGLPAQEPCDVRRAVREFTHRGIRTQPRHAIYRTWLVDYCQGIKLGPATSAEYPLLSGVTAQDFARTGHRLEWTGSQAPVQETEVWPWAISVFSRDGISPHWKTPITSAWFEQFFAGHNRGAALGRQHRHHGEMVQRFAHRCAVAHGTAVRWPKMCPAT